MPVSSITPKEFASNWRHATLTNLHNQRPTWLILAHRKLDEAVFAAYSWPPDLTDDEILERLLVLNIERSKTLDIKNKNHVIY